MQFKPGDLVIVVRMRNQRDLSLIGKSGEVLHVCACLQGCALYAITGKPFYRVGIRPRAECLREDCLRKISPPDDFNELEDETAREVPA
jgi:hypothetical protein